MRKIIQGFNRFMFFLATVPLFIMMMLTIIDVSGRYFGHPLPGTLEINQLFLALVCVWCWAHTQAVKGHISIDLLLKALPIRAQTIISIVLSFLGLVVAGLIALRAIPLMLTAKSVSEWTDVVQIPVWPFKAMLFVGAFFLALQIILDIIDNVGKLGKQTPVNTDDTSLSLGT